MVKSGSGRIVFLIAVCQSMTLLFERSDELPALSRCRVRKQVVNIPAVLLRRKRRRIKLIVVAVYFFNKCSFHNNRFFCFYAS